MNKRIRKKKTKQQLIRAISGLVEAAEEMQREQERRTRQAGISYIKYIEAVRERQYGITLHSFFPCCPGSEGQLISHVPGTAYRSCSVYRNSCACWNCTCGGLRN